jgi:uncharacterized secreted protein with C-terminal beta-propeller domain
MVVVTYGSDANDFGSGFLPAFGSYAQLGSYLDGADPAGFPYQGSPRTPNLAEAGSDSEYFSGTNVQVSGVDEADAVKTDGEYIYRATQHACVSVIKAVPAEGMEVVATMNIPAALGCNDTTYASIEGMILFDNKLAVLVNVNPGFTWWYSAAREVDQTLSPTDYAEYTVRAVIAVFDVSDPTSPNLKGWTGVSGGIITSRAVGTTVYVIAQQYAWWDQGVPAVPITYNNGVTSEQAADRIYYDPESNDTLCYISMLALDVQSLEINCASILTGFHSTVYMSQDYLYLTMLKWTHEVAVSDDATSSESVTTATTTIYKVAVEGLEMQVVARGDVNGALLNQYSMDQSGPYLRVATTTRSWFVNDESNAVYVLGQNLDVVGALEDIAPGESIYAARFQEDTLYLVTFRQTDPLFVIDLRNPSSPKIMGDLEMPGFSSYLHPVAEGYVLGIGSTGSNLKVALYDVTDPTAPREVSNYTFGDLGRSYSYTEAQWDFKAVLFDAQRGMLVIPASCWTYPNETDYNWTQWSGFLVFDVNPEGGIVLRGTVQHDWVSDGRALYIGEYLYTMDSTTIKASMITDLSLVSQVNFAEEAEHAWTDGIVGSVSPSA